MQWQRTLFVYGTMGMLRQPLVFMPKPFLTALWVPSTVRRVTTHPVRREMCLRSNSMLPASRVSASTAVPCSNTTKPSRSRSPLTETDRYWNAIVGNGGQESACGWCKDKWGVSWQITPRVLTAAIAAGGDEAKRAFDAMMKMRKTDVAVIEAARRGSPT